jgi:transcriptional antiterminator NusG
MVGEAEEFVAPEPRMNDESEGASVDEARDAARPTDDVATVVPQAAAFSERGPESGQETEVPLDEGAGEDGAPSVAADTGMGQLGREAAERLAKPTSAGRMEPAEVAEGGPPEEPDDGRRWYVVHCYSGYEAKVRHNLEQRVETMGMKSKIFDVVIPTEEEIEVKDGKRRTVERHVFPGYILVQMLMDEDSWYVVRNTPGVTGFVGMGNEPTPLRPEEVQQIIRRMEAEAPRVKVTYKAGQRVRIIDGPFNDFIGTVDEIDMERAKVRVMVSFFGRDTPVELDFLQVEKA